jgi:hypothetical protein
MLTCLQAKTRQPQRRTTTIRATKIWAMRVEGTRRVSNAHIHMLSVQAQLMQI